MIEKILRYILGDRIVELYWRYALLHDYDIELREDIPYSMQYAMASEDILISYNEEADRGIPDYDII